MMLFHVYIILPGLIDSKMIMVQAFTNLGLLDPLKSLLCKPPVHKPVTLK